MMKALLYLWQLPQNLLGWLVLRHYRTIMGELVIIPCGDVIVCYVNSTWQGCSIGKYIFLRTDHRFTDNVSICHEYGHSLQSQRLGWLYLPIVGIWSGVRCGLHLYRKGHYYDDWCERWADSLGGVKRDAEGRRYV